MDSPEEITSLRGFPPCPECDKQLSLREMPGLGETHWHCTGCGTQWWTSDLIEALDTAAKIAWALGSGDEVD